MDNLNQDDLTNALQGNDNDNSSNQDLQTETNTIPQKIKVGDHEYTQEELNEFVGLGKQTKEYEQKYNTKLDRVWPEYGRSQTRLKELEDQINKPKENVPLDKQQEIETARRAAKELGILTKDDLNELGIVTKADFDNYYRVQRATEKILEEAGDLEKEINGEDGRPAFRKEEILDYMKDTGILDMKTAYKVKYEPQLDAWKETKLAGAKKSGMSTMSANTPLGNKAPDVPKITRDNLNSMIDEALQGKF